MLNLSVNKNNILLTIIFAFLFGLSLCLFLPLATKNIFFILAIPLIGAFFLLMVINLKAMLVVLLFIRVLMDPLLNMTKLHILGENIGAGGVINLLIILLAAGLAILNFRRLSKSRFFRNWVVFLFICAFTIIYAPFPGRALKLFFNLLSYMAMALIPFFIVESRKDERFWLKIIFFSSFLPIAFANFDLLTGGSYYVYTGMRIKGTFTHPNILAFYLVLIIALVFYILKSRRLSMTNARRNFLLVYMADLFILLLATKTRSAWISCWGMFFIYGLLKEKKYLFLSLVVPLALLLHPAVMQRINNLFLKASELPKDRLNSFAWRMELWKSSLPWVKKRFFLGYGLGSFRRLSYNFFNLSYSDVASHNIYLEILFETGIIGLISYLAIYIGALKTFFRQMKSKASEKSLEYTIVFSYVISYMIVCFADNLLYYLAFNWYFWFFAGLMLRTIQLEGKNDFGYRAIV